MVTIITSETGKGATGSAPTGDGFKALLNLVNSKGGVNGRQIEDQVIDDQSSTTQAVAAVHQALGANPIAILDGSQSTDFNARLPIYLTAKTPVFATGWFSGPFEPFLFSTIQTYQAARALVGEAQNLLGGTLNGKKVALAVADTPPSAALVTYLKSLVKADGGSVSDSELQPVGSVSFSSGAGNILASGAQVVIEQDAGASQIIESKALIAAGFKGPIVGGYGSADNVSMMEIDSPQFYGERLVKQPESDTTMENAAQAVGVSATQANTQYFGEGWVLAAMLVDGLKACGSGCTSGTLPAAVDGLGAFTVPGDPGFSPPAVSSTVHHALTGAQFYVWDSATQTARPTGSPVSVGPPTYS